VNTYEHSPKTAKYNNTKNCIIDLAIANAKKKNKISQIKVQTPKHTVDKTICIHNHSIYNQKGTTPHDAITNPDNGAHQQKNRNCRSIYFKQTKSEF